MNYIGCGVNVCFFTERVYFVVLWEGFTTTPKALKKVNYHILIGVKVCFLLKLFSL